MRFATSLNARVKAATRDEHKAALTRWREQVHAAAAGGPIPARHVLRELGDVLRVDDPRRQFAADVESIVVVAAAKKRMAAVDARGVERLKPWGGKLANVRDEIKQLEKRIKELRSIERGKGDDHAAFACSRATARAKGGSPLVWQRLDVLLDRLAERDHVEEEARS
jgi:hypothetical protein